MAIAEKSRVSREISGLIFTAEATAPSLTNRVRILCLLIKNHAHVSAQTSPRRKLVDDVWRNYDELESMLRDRS